MIIIFVHHFQDWLSFNNWGGWHTPFCPWKDFTCVMENRDKITLTRKISYIIRMTLGGLMNHIDPPASDTKILMSTSANPIKFDSFHLNNHVLL